MLPNANLLTGLIFIICTAASPLNQRATAPPVGKVLLGYRTVKPDQYALYKAAGDTLVWSFTGSSDQTGKGAYLTEKLGAWFSPDTNYDCAIFADANAWSSVNKLWVPAIHPDGCTPLWYNAAADTMFKTGGRSQWISDVGGSSWTADNTALFSEISGFPYLRQLLIPIGLMGSSGGLSIITQCALKSDTAGIALLNGYGAVDWDTWAIKGPTYIATAPPAGSK